MVGKAPGSRRCWARQSHEFYSDPQPWLDTRASGTRTGVPQMLGLGLEDGGGQGEGLPMTRAIPGQRLCRAPSLYDTLQSQDPHFIGEETETQRGSRIWLLGGRVGI